MEPMIRLRYQKNFTSLEKEIAHYILENSEEVMNMTITELASKTYASPSTISRLCKKIGEKNYNDFRIHLMLSINNKENEIDYNRPFSSRDETKHIADNLEKLYISTIRETHELLDEKTIDQIVELISKNNFIDLYLTEEMYNATMSFIYKVSNIPFRVNVMSLGTDCRKSASFTTKDTLAIFISYTGQEDTIKEAVQIIKNSGGTVVAIVGMFDNYLRQNANYCLSICSKEYDGKKIESFSSIISVNYILDILFSCIYNVNYDINLIKKLTREKKYMK